MKAGPVEATGSAVSPGKTPVPGEALKRSILLAPQLAAGVVVGVVGTVEEILPKDLLALLVQAVRGPRQLSGEGHGVVRDVQQTVSYGHGQKRGGLLSRG